MSSNSFQKKYYVVWRGHHPGVYDDWTDALEQVRNFPNPLFKSFPSPEIAAEEYRKYVNREEIRNIGTLLSKADSDSPYAKTSGDTHYSTPLPSGRQPDYFSFPEIDLNGWAVDASCLGNPGVMEYRCVELMTGKEIFRVGPFKDATNNIGEFLAIVHALALMAQRGENHTVYSDSVTGMAWVRNRRIKTTLQQTPDNARLFDVMKRAMLWLDTHVYSTRILKWQTELWGEIPADFGRK
ncbi:MAG: ribonuclease H family protein [Muribaculaceae bacterium]|nr:ribonuclease H family protein [Muribaculaceae bacterium]